MTLEWIKQKTLRLNRYSFSAPFAVLDKHLLLSRSELTCQPDYLQDQLIYQLRLFVYGRKLESFTIQRPSSWFEAWKENAYSRGYLGPWARRLWPVVYEQKEIKAIEVFPSLAPDLGLPSMTMLYQEPDFPVQP